MVVSGIFPCLWVRGMNCIAELRSSASSIANQTVTVLAGLSDQKQASWCPAYDIGAYYVFDTIKNSVISGNIPKSWQSCLIAIDSIRTGLSHGFHQGIHIGAYVFLFPVHHKYRTRQHNPHYCNAQHLAMITDSDSFQPCLVEKTDPMVVSTPVMNSLGFRWLYILLGFFVANNAMAILMSRKMEQL